jgi:DNA invertase Pin-like site-specific DNA recombinase
MIIDGYVRVSQVTGRQGQSFISPALQREQIVNWAKLKGAVVATVFEELDESGARSDRPMLMEALARVEEGLTDGIVVAKLDRFGRTLLASLAAIERIRAAGGTFVAVQDGLDVTTDTGKLVLRIMLSMAEWELDRIRAQWNAARQRADARGVHMGAYPPTGYIRDSDRLLHPDPVSGPVITELFARRAQGATMRELGLFLSEQKVRTRLDNPNWISTALHSLITNRVNLGELRHGSIVNSESHEPLTDPVTWQAAQNPRVIARRAIRRSPTVLGGLLRCASCRMAMHSRTVTTRSGLHKRFYHCVGRSSAGNCQSRAFISGAMAEPYVDATFFALAARDRPSDQQNARMRCLLDAHKRAERELTEYRDGPGVLESLGEESFSEGLAKRREREKLAMLAISAERAKLSTRNMPTARELEDRWPALNVEQRRAAMSELIDCVFVFPREPNQERMLFVCARGDAPLDLPHRGRRSPGLLSFQPGRTPRAEPTADEARWTDAQINAGLEEFLGGWAESRWPADEDFIFAGRGPLLRQINRTGGPVRWTIGTSWSHLRRADWTEERIRDALRVILAGRIQWPTLPEFRALGFIGLYTALARRGRREWAAEYGLEYRDTGGAAKRWTEERIGETLAELCACRDTYPSQSEFAGARLAGLYVAIASRHGGHDKWAAKVGLPRPSTQRRTGTPITKWDDELIESQLRELIGRSASPHYPPEREFYDAGLSTLCAAIRRRGGHDHWARRLALSRPTARNKRGNGTSARLANRSKSLEGHADNVQSTRQAVEGEGTELVGRGAQN